MLSSPTLPFRPALCLAAALVAGGCSFFRPAGSGPAPAGGAPAAASAPSRPSFADAVKGARVSEGLFRVYRDTTGGSVMLAIRPDQFDRDFIYFTHVVDGVLAGGHFRGQFRDNAVVTIRRRFNKVEFVRENTAFYFDSTSALARASAANISPAVLAVEDVVAEDSAGVVLVKADALFLTEALAAVRPTLPPDAPPTMFRLGGLSKDRTALVDVRNYPENTNAVVRYVYENPQAMADGGPAVTDPRYVSVTVQHSLIAMPAGAYTPLLDDPRVGYFTERVTDLTSPSVTPYRDLVQRWHLVKRDPQAAVSAPVDPIVWWIENTTPEEYRDVIQSAALRWNEAFEAAGFQNAVEVRVQPDDAAWDAGDVRYNVLRWTSSPVPPFGGYGPSFSNPRTGQLLGADVMLEFVYIANRLVQAELFETAGLFFERADAADADPHHCGAGLRLQGQALLGVAALRAAGAPEAEMSRLVEESLYYLVLHEVGHTLGLNHNMRASQMLSPLQLQDPELTARLGTAGSVMDYPAVNLAPPGRPQGAYFSTRPGPYDVWAVQFAYAPMTEAEREALLARSTEPALAFGNDADDMRAPGRAVDPRVMIGDLSSDALTYAEGRLDLVDQTMAGLLSRYVRPGESYDELRQAYSVLTGEAAQQAVVASRYLGGVYVDRAVAGQPGGTRPFTPVPRAEQERALRVLTDRLFAPGALTVPDSLYGYLARQRRGFDAFGTQPDPRVHERTLGIQREVLDHLFHPNTLARVTDTRLYGNAYPLAEVMEALTDAVFAADLAGNVNTFRQGLQTEYVARLARVMANERDAFDAPSRAAALAQLRRVEGWMRAKRAGDAETRAHTAHVLFLVEDALDGDD